MGQLNASSESDPRRAYTAPKLIRRKQLADITEGNALPGIPTTFIPVPTNT